MAMRTATIYGVQEVPRPRLEELGQFIQSRVAWLGTADLYQDLGRRY